MRNIDLLGARRGAKSAGGNGGDDFSPPCLRDFALINAFASHAKFPLRVSLKRMHRGASRRGAWEGWRSGARKAAIVPGAPTVPGNQVEILSGYREPSGGNHPRKEGADSQERACDRAIERDCRLRAYARSRIRRLITQPSPDSGK
jgi:hypothetical protein